MPLIPFELQLLIISHLTVQYTYLPADRETPYTRWSMYHTSEVRALASCCLVCKAWLSTCRRELLKAVSLFSPGHLNKFIAALSSTTHLLGHTRELCVGVPDDSDSKPIPFHHLVAHYLSLRLPSLSTLR